VDYKCKLRYWHQGKGKGKAVPLQAWSGQEGSRKLRLPDYMTTAQDGGKVVSLTHWPPLPPGNVPGRLHLKCDGTHTETRFRLSAKRTSPFKSAGASVQSTTDSRGVRISGSNAGYAMFRGSVKGTGYPPHSSVSPSLSLLCVTACHHISTGLYSFLLEAESTPGP
jgi:hypothetical protein